MIQSLKAIDDLDEFFAGYGLDRRRRVPPPTRVLVRERPSGGHPARHFLGLTATPYRRDGLQEIVTMQCGPIRHQITSSEGPAREVSLELEVRETKLAVAEREPRRRSRKCSAYSSKTRSARRSSATT